MPPNKTLAERVAALEATQPEFGKKLDEIGADVKLLVAAHNTEQGAKDEKKQSERRRLAAYGTFGGFVGAALTAAADYFSRH